VSGIPRGRALRWTLAVGLMGLVSAAGWFAIRAATRPASPTGGAVVTAGSLDDLLMDLQLVPLDGQAPKPFALESLDGRRVALADLAGKPALLYFWATW
jgi:cytochrome oxidase Cu insertion factor (SCO1/SenC/PrrC family)